MASLTIRNLDPAVKDRLRVRAAERGRSMEEEARLILRRAVNERVPVDAPNQRPAADPGRGSVMALPQGEAAREAVARCAETLLEIGRSWSRDGGLGGARSEDHADLYGEDGLPR